MSAKAFKYSGIQGGRKISGVFSAAGDEDSPAFSLQPEQEQDQESEK